MAGEQRIKLDMDISDLKKHIRDGYQKLSEMENKFKELNEQLDGRTVEDLGESLKKALEKPDKQIDKLKGKLQQLHNQYAKFEKQYNKAVESDDKKGASLAKSNMDYVDKQDLQITNQINSLEEEKQRIIEKTTQEYTNQTEAIRKQAEEVISQFNALDEINKNDADTLKNLENPLNKLVANFKDAGSQASKLFDGIFAKFKANPTKNLQKGMTSVLSTTKRFAMSLLGAYSAYSLISKAVNQIKEQNKELANTMNTLWNGLVSLVTPIVNALVSAFATALNYIIKIASVISGINVLGKLKQANKKANSSSGGSKTSKLYSFDTSETLKKDSSSGGTANTEGLLKDIELNEKLQGYAKKLQTIWDNIKETASNLVDRIKEGWNYMNAGQRIMQVIDNLINAWLDDMIEITEATKKWSETINFGPLFDSIATLLEVLEPILEKIGDLIVWIWKEIVLPLGTYLIEKLIPAINNTLASALTVIDRVLQGMADILLPLWENVLKPLFEKLGEGVLNGLDKLKDFFTSIAENKTAIEVLSALATALLIVVTTITTLTGAFKLAKTVAEGLFSVFTLATSPLGLVVIAFTALIAVIILCIQHWDEIKEKVNEVLASIVSWVSSSFENIKETVSTWWTNFKDRLEEAKEFWTELVLSIIEWFQEQIQALKDWISEKWEAFKQAISDGIQWVKDKIIEWWEFNTAKLQELLDKVIEWWASIKEKVSEGVNKVLDFATDLWNGIKEKAQNIVQTVKDTVQSVKDWFADLLSYVTDKFSTAWQKAWNGVKSFFGNIWNGMLDVVEGIINGMVKGINWVISKMNSLSWDIPDWVPLIGGKSFGFDIKEVSSIDLSDYRYVPALAQGAVIPPNKEFLAMLGDQTRGRNLEAPEGLLREIVQEESGTQQININATGSMAQLIKLLRLELQKEDKRVGTSMIVGG